MELDPRIYFIVVIPDGDPYEATPLQGFSPTLCEMSWAVRAAALMPTDILELTNEGHETLLARRMSGTAPVNWYGQTPRAIRSIPWPAQIPFAVIILPPSENATDYQEWLSTCQVRPTLVATQGGDLDQISVESLQARFLAVCDTLPPEINPRLVEGAKQAISSWKAMPDLALDYQVGGHNTITPNLASLTVAGYEDMVRGRFDVFNKGVKPYVEQIVKTTNSIFDARQAVGGRDIQRIFRLPPDLNLFAPAIFPHFFSLPPPPDFDKAQKRGFLAIRQSLERQNGYSFDIRTEAQKEAFIGKITKKSDGTVSASPNALMSLRASELWLNTDLMAAFTASEFSACVRLPNEINRTSGSVRNFAEHYRSDEPARRKRLLAFRAVQDRLAAAVPKEFYDLIRRSESGVRVVSDAHLEWLNIDGLPLTIRKNCTRIPVTPGNLFVDQLAPQKLLHLSPNDFKEVLVISALKADDPIRGLFRTAFETFEPQWRGKLTVKIVEVSTEDELVAAFNEFEGPLVIFDGHGSHSPDHPALLHLGDTAVDVWSLREKIQNIAPIIVLSACDTHAADRNHATTANGFMSLGARTVLSSVFPLLARDAAVFTARLVYRVSEFIPAAIRMFDQGITWTEVISGMLRMQLMTDFLRLLEQKGSLDDETYRSVHLTGNTAINGLADDPFEVVLGELEKLGLPRADLQRDLEMAVANSSTISYLQIGRPETIIIDDAKRIAEQMKTLNSAAELI